MQGNRLAFSGQFRYHGDAGREPSLPDGDKELLPLRPPTLKTYAPASAKDSLLPRSEADNFRIERFQSAIDFKCGIFYGKGPAGSQVPFPLVSRQTAYRCRCLPSGLRILKAKTTDALSCIIDPVSPDPSGGMREPCCLQRTTAFGEISSIPRAKTEESREV